MVLELSQCEKSKNLDDLRGCLGHSGLFLLLFHWVLFSVGLFWNRLELPGRPMLAYLLRLQKLGITHRTLLGPHFCGLIDLGQSTEELVKKVKGLGSSLLFLLLDSIRLMSRANLFTQMVRLTGWWGTRMNRRTLYFSFYKMIVAALGGRGFWQLAVVVAAGGRGAGHNQRATQSD